MIVKYGPCMVLFQLKLVLQSHAQILIVQHTHHCVNIEVIIVLS